MKKYPGVKVGPTLTGTISKDGVHPNPKRAPLEPTLRVGSRAWKEFESLVGALAEEAKGSK